WVGRVGAGDDADERDVQHDSASGDGYRGGELLRERGGHVRGAVHGYAGDYVHRDDGCGGGAESSVVWSDGCGVLDWEFDWCAGGAAGGDRGRHSVLLVRVVDGTEHARFLEPSARAVRRVSQR